MANQNFSANYTSADLEKAALKRFRALMRFLPEECKIFREIWGSSTVLCLDFARCPHLLEATKQQSFLLLIGANYLGLTNSLLFRVDKKVIDWTTLSSG